MERIRLTLDDLAVASFGTEAEPTLAPDGAAQVAQVALSVTYPATEFCETGARFCPIVYA